MTWAPTAGRWAGAIPGFPPPNWPTRAGNIILEKARWQYPEAGQRFAQNNLILGCCAGGALSLSNSFLPLAAVQVEGRDGAAARGILRWLEANHGRAVDLDGDGHCECYYYTDDALRIVTTGNIAAALATDRDSLRQLFRTARRPLLAEPTLAHVDYPNVYVRTAEYRSPVLRFTVLKGRPGFRGTTEIVCQQIPPQRHRVARWKTAVRLPANRFDTPDSDGRRDGARLRGGPRFVLAYEGSFC